MGERTRVLVADDNGTYGALLSRFVASQPDMELIGLASNGGDAIQLASMFHPDVVLMDLCMPGLDGFEATRVLTDTLQTVKVIALTAHREADSEQRVRSAGAVAFIRKSEVDAQLLETIRGLTLGTNEDVPPGPDGGRTQA